MVRPLALLLSLLCPALVAAQSLADARVQEPAAPMLVDQLLRANIGNPALGSLQATPLWSTPDGHVLAIVALGGDNAIPSKPQSPQIGSAADWKLVDVTNFVTSGLLLNFDRDAAAYATLTRGAVLGPLLAPGAALPCGPLAGSGSLSAAGCNDRAALARSSLLQVGSAWTILDNLDLDLSYGLGWLRHETTPGIGAMPIDLFGAIGNPQFPTLLVPGLQAADVQNAGVTAAGHWRLDGPSVIDFGASLSRLQLYAPSANAPALTSLNQAAVTFGLHHGAFGGVVTGHVLGQADAFSSPGRWAGLDIGFSWRTPWQGELIFGTQNLWSSGSLPSLPDAATREIESNQARVPYVQYHQDL